LTNLNQKLGKTEEKIKTRDWGACACVNVILVVIGVIVYLMVSSNMDGNVIENELSKGNNL
jgi:amino acid permease